MSLAGVALTAAVPLAPGLANILTSPPARSVGQIWAIDPHWGFIYSDKLWRELRMAVQPMSKFRQFCDRDPNKVPDDHALVTIRPTRKA